MALLLVLAVAAVYGQTWGHGFIAFDDDTYVTANPAVARGLSWQGLRWAFGFHAGNWHPLTWLSHMLDAALFGPWAGGHHLVSAGLHAANAALLAAVLAAMTGRLWRSAAVAALFAVHPLRVESVAWVAERKDVLSATLLLLAVGAYLRYARRPGPRPFLAALGLFALGLAAKPMLVTLPFVLLLLDWWPLGRALPARAGESTPAGAAFRDWRPLVDEKWPFFALSLLASLLALRAQAGDALPFVAPDLGTRLANAAVSYVGYLGALLWPDRLAFLYPYPRSGVPAGAAVAALAALVSLSAAALLARRRRPYLAVGWLWFLGTLVPVIGLVQVGGQARADRYTYLATTGVALALVWLAGDLRPRRAGARRVLAGAFVVVLVLLAGAAAAYVRVWRDSVSLFEHTVRVTEGNYLVLANLGPLLAAQGREAEALAVLREAVRINPDHCNASYNLGVTLLRGRRHEEAIAPLASALACYEREGRRGAYLADAHANLGFALTRLGRQSQAERHLLAALAIAPAHPGARRSLAEVRAAPRQRGGSPGPPRERGGPGGAGME